MRVLGTNHRLTPPSQVQRAVACKEAIFTRLLELQASGEILGAVLLATCNRLELILDAEQHDEELATAILGDHAGLALHDSRDAEATHYLLRVATGLESMVRGEDQILGQLRHAFKHSEQHDLLSPRLRTLQTQLMSAARDTRQRAGLINSKVSVASLAARQLESAGQRFVIIGAGETGRLAIESLVKRGFTDLLIVNRTVSRAEALARHFGIEAMSLRDFLAMAEGDDDLPYDGVLFAIDSQRVVFEAIHCGGLKAVVDVSMPCVLGNSVRSVPGLRVCDLDDIAQLVEVESERRARNLEVASDLARARARTLHASLTASRGDNNHLAQILEQHLDTAMQELHTVLGSKLQHLSDDDQATVRDVILRTTKRNAHLHLRDVREFSKT